MTDDIQKLIQEKLNQAQTLFQEKKFPEVFAILQEILKTDAKQKDALNLLDKTKDEYLRYKDAMVERTIIASQPLWKEKRYEELKKIYNELEVYYPKHPKILKGLELLQNMDLQNAVRQFEAQFEQAQSLYYKKDYENAIKTCQEILKIDPSYSKAINLLSSSREKFVDSKLPLAKEIDPRDIPKLREFYLKLYEVAPHYGKIRRLLGQTEQSLNNQKKQEETKYINDRLLEIKTIIEKGACDEAIDLCEELLKIDPLHYKIKKLLSLAQKKQEKTIMRELLKQMKEETAKLALEYKADKSKFIKI